MEIVKTAKEVRDCVKGWKKQGLSIGFVPTMGYLHEGHGSLIKEAGALCHKVVVSIFVNPMQFGENEDFGSYPRDLERDAAFCREMGADLIFAPDAEEMYTEGFCSYVDMEGLTRELCGKSRPGHFRGVCTVVCKLFNIVTPDKAFFGQKDGQQLAVIRRMTVDLNLDIEIVGCPIVREPDGLAKSSRNTYLSREERKAALALSRTIEFGRELVRRGITDPKELTFAMKKNIEKESLANIDYVEAVLMDTIEKTDRIRENVLVAMAVYVGKTRLIDNFIVGKADLPGDWQEENREC
ncbi:MAG: pantoate--beta-alanine ligase [Clostridium sp.]|nr:pantoate--beta-alanine ligase [Clostridium sp.]